MTSQLVWLITGTSSGFGYYLTVAALKRGDKVIATARARSLDKLEPLKQLGADVLELDVTTSQQDLNETAKTATAMYGRVDVLVNNAGYIMIGALEESTEKEAFDQFNTNIFGALNVTKAFLPYMRKRKSGTVVFIGSLGSIMPYPNCGLYVASKAALREISITLHEEIAPFGLRSTCIEPGFFRTDVLTVNNRSAQQSRIPDYQYLADQAREQLEAFDGHQPGDPEKGVNVIIDVVRAEGVAAGKPFPTVLGLGSDYYPKKKALDDQASADLEEWKDVIISTDYSDA